MSPSIHKILFATAASLIAGTAMAADGTIAFTGNITAASCAISAGNGATVSGTSGKQTIGVDLGTVSTDSLGATSGSGIVAGTAINLELACSNTGTLTGVKVHFDPMSGSGVDGSNNKLLKIAGSATGVGIGIYDTNGTLLNLGANETFDAPLVAGDKGAIAALALRAAYVANGGKLAAGSANGTLPFTLTYQ